MGCRDRLFESGDVNFTLTDAGLTGPGTDTLANIQEVGFAATSGDNRLDASAFTGAVTLIGGDRNDSLVSGELLFNIP